MQAGEKIWAMLVPLRALADPESVSTAIRGAERIAAYWTLGVCSVAFVTLVSIWSVMLKKRMKSTAMVRTRVRK